MAQKGTYSAYKQLVAPRTNFGALADSQYAKLEARRKEEKADREKLEAEQLALAEGMATDIANVKEVISGVRSVDEVNTRLMSNVRQEIGDIYRMFRDDPMAQRDFNLQLRLANLRQTPQLVAQAQEKLTAYVKDVTQGVQTGKYSEAMRGELDELEALFGYEGEDGKITPNYVIDLNDDGTMRVRGIKRDGQYFERSLNDVLSGYEYGNPILRQDMATVAARELGAIGSRERAMIEKGQLKTKRRWDYVKGEVEAHLSLSDNEMKALWTDHFKEDLSTFDDKAKEKIREELMGRLEYGYKETTQSKQLTVHKPSAEDIKANERLPENNIHMDTDETGNPIKPTEGPGMDSRSFTLKHKPRFIRGNRVVEVSQIVINSDRTATIKGRISKVNKDPNALGAGDDGSWEDYSSSDRDQLSEVAVELGLENTNKMYQYLSQKSGLKTKQTKATTSGFNWEDEL